MQFVHYNLAHSFLPTFLENCEDFGLFWVDFEALSQIVRIFLPQILFRLREKEGVIDIHQKHQKCFGNDKNNLEYTSTKIEALDAFRIRFFNRFLLNYKMGFQSPSSQEKMRAEFKTPSTHMNDAHKTEGYTPRRFHQLLTNLAS